MKTHFHQEIEKLKLKVLEMAAMAERALEKAVRGLAERDVKLCQEVVEGDCLVNAKQDEIDEICLRLLALDQPMASDLRFIIGSMHVVVNLERVADQAVNIAERALLLAQRPAMPHNPAFEDLALTVREMVSQSVAAYNDGSYETAEKVCEMDVKADNLNMKLLKQYVDYMVAESRAVERAVHMITLASNLERVGDHATNIGEYVMFIVRGVNVKSRCHS